MGHGGMKLGPLALLLAVVCICVETLAILAIATASANLRIAGRYADMVKIRYALEEEGQMFLQEARETVRTGKALALLPGTETDDAGVTRKEIWKNDYRLTAGVQIGRDGQLDVVCWRIGRVWKAETNKENLWNGP